ncbi:MAG: amino acid kinase family protein, partial [Gemmatimonadota bacterium]
MSAHPGTVVVAIGGNALSPSGESASVTNQFRHTRESLASIVDLARDGWRIAIVHGNGPQVGDELLRNEEAREEVEPLPLGVLVAATAGWIGYMIQQSLENALAAAGSKRRVVTLITQSRVDPNDPSMRTPTKFIGRGLSESAAEDLRAEGILIEEDPRGNLRRRVASPVPVEIVESEMVRELVTRGDIVIAAGGGGIPVYCDPVLGLEGVDAVVDKDRAAAILG